MKATLVILFAAIASVCAARELQQATTGRVTFFDNTDFSGGGQAFSANVPATGCGDCTNLYVYYITPVLNHVVLACQNFVRTNSWESYTSNAGSTIVLYDGHFCTGKDSGSLPAKQGPIRGSLSDSVDSFRLCA